MKRFAFLLALLIAGCVSPPVQDNATSNDTVVDISGIDSFEDCVAAGNPVMESYPRQCRAGDKTFVSLTDLFDVSKDQSCSADSDCRLVDEELGFSCCWAGACDAIDYSLDRWVAVNGTWYGSMRGEHCPSDCGPAPGCPVQLIDDNYSAACSDGICEKVPIIYANLSANNITIDEENITDGIEEPEPPEIPEGIRFDRYILVLDDIILPRQDDTCGAFSVRHLNGTVLDKLIICERESEYWVTPEGHRYRIFAVELAGGYTYKEKWADVRIYG